MSEEGKILNQIIENCETLEEIFNLAEKNEWNYVEITPGCFGWRDLTIKKDYFVRRDTSGKGRLVPLKEQSAYIRPFYSWKGFYFKK